MLTFNPIEQGTYWRAFHFGRQLARRGLQISLVTSARRRRFGLRTWQEDGLTIVETPDLLPGSLRSGWDPWNTLNRLGWLRRQDFDLVHAFEARPTVLFPALAAAARPGVPLVMDWADWFGRGGSVEERPNPLVRTVLRPVETYFEERFRTRAQATTVICTTLRDKAIALGVPPESIVLLPNGADTERLRPMPLVSARHAAGLSPEAFIIGYVGTIFAGDAHLMAAAFDAFSRQVPEAQLLIAGYCPFDLRPLVRSPERVLQTGRLAPEQLNTYLAASDLFWLPLRDTPANRGRFPLKLTDYLAIGRPVVATAVGDVPLALEGTGAGLLAPDRPEALAEHSLQLYADEQQRLRMGSRARQLAETRYNWENLSAELERLYLQALKA